MGRLLRSVIRVHGELVAATPVHSGGLGEDAFSDLPLAVDGKGGVYFPGSGIAGPLRAWWRSACPDLVDSVWGRVESDPGPEQGEDWASWASILIVHDAPLIDRNDRELAQRVGIDPETGTAAGARKFDRELVPVQARFRFSLALQRPAGRYGPRDTMDEAFWNRILGVLRGMLEDLAEGVIRFGADKSRGRGRLRLRNARISNRNLAGGILATLHNEAEPEDVAGFFGNKIAAVRPVERPLAVMLACTPVAPVMQRHEAEGAAVDMLPAITIEGEKRKPFLSGTGIKGAFRAQSERILRTVLGRQEIEEDDPDNLDLVVALYGDRAKKTEPAAKPPDRDDPRYRQPGRGAVTFDDCRFDRELSLADWRKLLMLASDGSRDRLATFRNAAHGTAWSGFTPAAMVAIDRWTGGTADRFLFSRLEPDLGPIMLSAAIHRERIAPPPDFWKQIDNERREGDRDLLTERRALSAFRRAALALFLLTLRDFARGRIPLGYGVNRGLGDLDLDRVTFSDAAEWEGVSLDIALAASDFDDGENMTRFQPLQEAWDAYLKRNAERRR